MELVTEFFYFMLEFAFWVFIIALVRGWAEHREREFEEERKELIEEVAKHIHQVKQEKHADTYYWFDEQTDQFLGQGCSEDEIRIHLLERFKGHIFLIDEKRALAGPELKLIPVDQIAKLYNINKAST